MLLRKANAIISLLTTALLLDHAIFYSVWMLSRCTIQKSAAGLPWLLAGLMVLHAVLCILLAIRGHKGTNKTPVKAYPMLNIPTMLQRATGMLLLVLLVLHIAGSANHFQPKMLHAVLHPLFFAVALAHTAVSVSKALITLGIGSVRVLKIVNILIGIVCAGTWLAGCIGFQMCLFMGVAR